MEEHITGFQTWFERNGGYLGPGIEISFDPKSGYHLRLPGECELAAGSCIISCPHSLAISHWNSRQDGHSPWTCSEAFDWQGLCASSQLNFIRFFLIEQYQLKQSSFWWPYIQILPQPFATDSFNTPLFFDEADTSWILGTGLGQAMEQMEQLWRRQHSEGIHFHKSQEHSRYSWDLYRWAATVITSRSFPGSALANAAMPEDIPRAQSPVLIPGLDILNHDPSAKVRWQWTGKDCQIVTEATLQGRLQVHNNYAIKSNAELIMGYGFSLFRNQADYCTLLLGPAATSRITAYIERGRGDDNVHLRRQHSNSTPSEERLSLYSYATAFCNLDTLLDPGRQSIAPNLGFVQLAGIHYQQQNGLKFPYIFSPGFLEDASIAFSNQREFQQDDIGRSFEIDSLELRLTRLKLHVVCAVVMILQRQQAWISQHDSRLPQWPENDRQFYAARYRRGQLRILGNTTNSIIRRVRCLSGLETSCPRDMCLVRLEHILEESPKELATDFRSILHTGFGTRNPTRIRSSLLVESTFALWLCGLWLLSNTSVGFRPLFATESAFGLKISQWLLFLRRVYNQSFKRIAESVPARLEEAVPLAESCHAVIKAGVKKKPASIYNRPEVTHKRLLWCLDVIREESFMTPDLDGKFGEENDGFVLFMECGTE